MCDPITSLLGTTLFTVGALNVTVGGAIATTALAATAIAGGVQSYQSARATAKAQKATAEAIASLEDNTGTTGVSKTTSTLEDNTSTKRTLSSLRISLLPQATSEEETTSNVYGVDSNLVTDSNQNTTGLNIAA